MRITTEDRSITRDLHCIIDGDDVAEQIAERYCEWSEREQCYVTTYDELLFWADYFACHQEVHAMAQRLADSLAEMGYREDEIEAAIDEYFAATCDGSMEDEYWYALGAYREILARMKK